MTNEVIRMSGVTKRYVGTVAVSNVDLELYEGEVLAIIGDNGAGKSTLIKMISGAVIPDEGNIFVNGENVNIKSPADSLKLGIETIYQDLALYPSLDLTTNIFSGRECIKDNLFGRLFSVIDKKKMREEAQKVLSMISFNIPSVKEKVENFSGGQKQAIAITRANIFSNNLLIMDEPTAALGIQESAKVIDLIKDFMVRKTVKSIIVISHNMEHVIDLANRVIVMRMGKRVGTVDIDEYKKQGKLDKLHSKLVALITGLEFN